LREGIESDRAAGHLPFLVVATAGTTSAGTVDPLPELAEIARETGLWYHVDAAWGGAAALVPELRPVLLGIERADSVTFDAHKLLSVPMGAGMFFTPHRGILERTFRITAGYMPREASGLAVVDPYSVSMQWSRRFIGLKLFLSLLVAGWDGYAEAIRHQTRMGAALRERLTRAEWRVVNETPLPVVCFQDARYRGGDPGRHQNAVLGRVLASGRAWISGTELPHHGPALRACITHYGTETEDLDGLVNALERARGEVGPNA
jgi:glutamate/tyrosine decarboxylase-like PLP-dependent enzyme